MTTIYVDIINLDGSRPEGTLRFSIERPVLGDPDIVPSSVEVGIRNGKARVDGLSPGAMRARVSTAGGWSKAWYITIPESGEHDLFDLLGLQAKDFQETVWAALAGRVEKLEQRPAPAPVDLAPLEERVTALESKPAPEPFDPSALQAQIAELQSHLTPVDMTVDDGVTDDLAPVWATGSTVGVVQHAGRVSINVRAFQLEETIRALDGLELPHFPEVATHSGGGLSNCEVELFQGAKFLTKLDPRQIYLRQWGGPLTFHVAVDEALAVGREVGANRMHLSAFYYTNALPPHDSTL